MDKNMTLKEIQNRLIQWEASENPLAGLTSAQREAIQDLEALLTGKPVIEPDLPEQNKNKVDHDSVTSVASVNNTFQFLDWYENLQQNNLKTKDAPYEAYYKQLEDRKNECVSLMDQIQATRSDLSKLTEQYNLVSDKTNALHTMSEQLLADQTKLSSIGEDIKTRLHYFTQVEHLGQRLNSPTMSVNSEAFFTVLAKIDECLEYIKANSNFKESYAYQIKYRTLQSRAISRIRSYVSYVLTRAAEQVLAPFEEGSGDDDVTSAAGVDAAYAVYFGKFQAAAPKLRMVIGEIEKRAETNADYLSFLSDIQQQYTHHRSQVSGASSRRALTTAAETSRDHCTLLRTSCSLLALACRDECALYQHFFAEPSQALDDYLQSLCNGLYETLRPRIIHVNHLETLAEICLILRVEVIEEQVNNDPWRLRALGAAARSLLADAQERLGFRGALALRRDVLLYRPAAPDLAYPAKLALMQQIAQSLHEQAHPTLSRSDSLASSVSDTSREVAAVSARSAAPASSPPSAPSAPSPADLHGMWYPALRRTLAALSRLYRCLEKRVFQGIAQEAISYCVQSIDNATQQISENQTVIDGELFKIKHLLILREQIAPFQVEFVVKETSLDFSNVKNAAYGLIQKPKQIFSLNSNNALLEFLLEGTPQVREHLLDSRKEVDRQLKKSCENFIKNATEVLCGPLIQFVEKAQAFQPVEQLSLQPFATAEQMSVAVKEAQRRIRSQLAPLQKSMQLYLANKETEFILFRPIRNNVVGNFVQIEQFITNGGYSYDDRLIVACPTPEQMSVFMSSASLISHADPVLPYGQKKPLTVQRPSVTSLPTKSEDDDEKKDQIVPAAAGNIV